MTNLNHVERFIFTGTPGSGKTSVIKEREKLGHAVIHEAATEQRCEFIFEKAL